MSKLHYFAYGSNLHPLRLQERVPSACVIGVVEAKGRKLSFVKKSIDGSGKCSFCETGNPEDVVYGVLYELDAVEKAALDNAESKGYGYDEQIIDLELNGISFAPFTYIANSQHCDDSLQPYEWYKQFVLAGARYHSMPEGYISWLDTIAAIPDPDAQRCADNMARLNAMNNHAFHGGSH